MGFPHVLHAGGGAAGELPRLLIITALISISTLTRSLLCWLLGSSSRRFWPEEDGVDDDPNTSNSISLTYDIAHAGQSLISCYEPQYSQDDDDDDDDEEEEQPHTHDDEEPHAHDHHDGTHPFHCATTIRCSTSPRRIRRLQHAAPLQTPIESLHVLHSDEDEDKDDGRPLLASEYGIYRMNCVQHAAARPKISMDAAPAGSLPLYPMENLHVSDSTEASDDEDDDRRASTDRVDGTLRNRVRHILAAAASVDESINGQKLGGSLISCCVCLCHVNLCTGDQAQQTIYKRLPGCGHVFHTSCLHSWLHACGTRIKAVCPLCRSPCTY